MLLADLVDDVRPDVPGCPDFAIRAAIQKACVEFLYQSRYWLVTLDPIAMASGQYVYDLSTPNDTIILQLYNDGKSYGVKYNDCGICVTTEALINSRPRSTTGAPQYLAFTVNDDQVVVWPTPGADQVGDTLSIMAIMGGQRTITELPDPIAMRFQDGLVSGAKARLMSSVGKPWSNPPQAALEQSRFWYVVNNAKRESPLSMSRYAAPQSVQMRPFA